jgi:uncharacterized membrane protein YbaN (DUF454 family)
MTPGPRPKGSVYDFPAAAPPPGDFPESPLPPCPWHRRPGIRVDMHRRGSCNAPCGEDLRGAARLFHVLLWLHGLATSASDSSVSPDPIHHPPEVTRPEDVRHRQQVIVHAWWQRLLLRLLAGISLGLAIIGAVLPGLPTTVFVLIAAWAAARSSPGLHAWLMQHSVFGPVLHNWNNGRCVSRRAKRAAAIVMSLSAAWMVYALRPRWLAAVLLLIMASVLVWLWRRPEPPVPERPSQR